MRITDPRTDGVHTRRYKPGAAARKRWLLALCTALLFLRTSTVHAQGMGDLWNEYWGRVGDQFLALGNGVYSGGQELVYMGHDGVLGVGNVAVYAATLGNYSYDYDSWSGLQKNFDAQTHDDMSWSNMYYHSSITGGVFIFDGATLGMRHVASGLYSDVTGTTDNAAMTALGGTALQAVVLRASCRSPNPTAASTCRGACGAGGWTGMGRGAPLPFSGITRATSIPPAHEAITRYQSGPHCEAINGSLRSGKYVPGMLDELGLYSLGEMMADITALDRAAAPSPGPLQLFRQCTALRPDSPFTFENFCSLTDQPSGAFSLNGQGGAIYPVLVPKGCPVIRTPGSSAFSAMGETILPRGYTLIPDGHGGFIAHAPQAPPPIPFASPASPPSVPWHPPFPVWYNKPN